MQPHVNKYLETAVQTATPIQLLIMLYDGAIRFCRIGIDAIQHKNYAEANHNLIKCQNIIREFMVTIDRDASVSDGLIRLYDYFIFRLIEANTKKVTEPAEEVLAHLIELKATWIQAAKEASKSSVGLSHG